MSAAPELVISKPNIVPSVYTIATKIARIITFNTALGRAKVKRNWRDGCSNRTVRYRVVDKASSVLYLAPVVRLCGGSGF